MTSPPEDATTVVPDAPGKEDTTVQMLVEGEGNRDAIRGMLDGRYDVVTDQTVGSADCYLVDGRLVSSYREALRAVVEDVYPVFCPVVVMRRPDSAGPFTLGPIEERETPPLVDDVVDAPLDKTVLVRRLDTLLVRRQQSETLQAQVTALEERERELRSFKQAVERSGHSISITDTDGTIRYVNEAFEEVTGYSAAEAVGESTRILKSGEHSDPFYADLWGTILDGEVWEGEVINERKDGQRYVVEQTIAPILEGGDIERFVSVNSDITDRISREWELERRGQELDLLRQILTRVLRHNVRNDLSVILGHAQQLQTELDESSDSLSKIIEKTQAIAETSETARDIAGFVERDESRSEQNVSALVESVAADVRAAYPDASISVDVPEECAVYASSNFRQAVHELVENAATHNGNATPRVDVTLRQSNGVELVVEDDGPGIPKEELIPLQEDEETQLHHGSNMGLWLVNWVLKRSGGDVDVEVTDEGTRVVLTLPEREHEETTVLGTDATTGRTR